MAMESRDARTGEQHEQEVGEEVESEDDARVQVRGTVGVVLVVRGHVAGRCGRGGGGWRERFVEGKDTPSVAIMRRSAIERNIFLSWPQTR